MNSPAEDDGTLGTGTRLGEFEIRGLVGVGGFGIVYRAFDHDLEREVAIKEYMPGLLASRTVNGEVQPRSRTHAETFSAGMRSFMVEAKMLARFDHPALVKVFRYWEGNGTAYMVMPLYQGQTLGHVLKQMPAPPNEAWLMGVLVPLLGALEVLHSQQIFHRDVSPDNILLLRNGRPVLLDFGAARQVISDRTQTLTAILKPNYAPIEQYAEVPNLRQGPWTDLYALGAVVYASLTGRPPPPAAARTIQDDIIPLTEVAAELEGKHGLRYSRAFLDAWQQTLAVRPADRPQNVADLMRRLGLMPTATLGLDDDSTVIVPHTAGGSTQPPPRQDSDWTVVVTGQRFTHHPEAYNLPPIAAATSPTADALPPADPLPTTIAPPASAEPAPAPEPPVAERPVTITQRSGLSQPTGRDMRMIPPGATLPPATGPAPAATRPGAVPAAAPARPPVDPLTPLESPPRKGGGLLIGAVAGALALAAGGYFLLRSAGPTAPAAEAMPAAASAAAPAARAPSANGLPLPAPVASRPAPPMITEYPEETASKPAAAASRPAAAASRPAPAMTPATSATATGTATGAAAAPPAASAAVRPDKAAQAAAKASAAAAKASAAAAQAAAKASAAAAAAATSTRQGPATSPSATNAAPASSSKSASPGTASSGSNDRPARSEPRTLDDVCGKRVLVAHALCVQEACQTAEFSHHPTCVDIRRKAEEENRRQMNAGG